MTSGERAVWVAVYAAAWVADDGLRGWIARAEDAAYTARRAVDALMRMADDDRRSVLSYDANDALADD